jgi:hypothetical protein
MHDAFETSGAYAVIESDVAVQSAHEEQEGRTVPAPQTYVWAVYPEFFRKVRRRYRLPEGALT